MTTYNATSASESGRSGPMSMSVPNSPIQIRHDSAVAMPEAIP